METSTPLLLETGGKPVEMEVELVGPFDVIVGAVAEGAVAVEGDIMVELSEPEPVAPLPVEEFKALVKLDVTAPVCNDDEVVNVVKVPKLFVFVFVTSVPGDVELGFI